MLRESTMSYEEAMKEKLENEAKRKEDLYNKLH